MHNPLFLLPLLAVATTAYPGFNQPRQEPSGTPYPGNCKWNALGCWIDPAGTRLLTTVKYYDDALTIEKCLTRCEGYKYAMVEYKRFVPLKPLVKWRWLSSELGNAIVAIP